MFSNMISVYCNCYFMSLDGGKKGKERIGENLLVIDTELDALYIYISIH